MKSSEDTQTLLKVLSERTALSQIRLTIQGLGHVPTFKNGKSAFIDKTGKQRVVTNKKNAQWMKEAIQLIELQLLTRCQTTGTGTMTGLSLQSWIALSVPEDDSRQWIVDERIVSVEVPKGEEGCEIIIERLS